MTANFRTVELAPASVDLPQSRLLKRSVTAWPDRLVFPALLASLLLMFGLLQNPYWVPAGDSELYTAAARNMARGEGYTFNGQSIAIIPPGWSWMMSVVMRITPYVLPLKLLAMTCMIGSLACGYWIARRFVSPLQAFSVILLTAVLSHVYQATYWLISESSFCLATSASILIAMQIAEHRRQWWRVALLLVLCASAVMIRWAGFINMMLVVAVLLDGQWKPKLSMPWIASGLVVLVTLGTFIGLREGLRGTPEESAAASDMVTGTGEDTGIVATTDGGPPITGAANQSAKHYQLFPTGSYADRLMNWGRWFSYLFWQPFRAAGASVWILRLATLTGWTLIALLAVHVANATRKMQWIWLATGLYAGALAFGWTNVNARYYVPIAFLILLAIFLSTEDLLAMARGKWRTAVWVGFIAFVGSVIACNAALYAVEVKIARSNKFYSRYETGLNMSLISACQYLMDQPQPPKDGEIAVSQRYTNLNRSKASPFGLRAAVLLTGREVVTPRFKDTSSPPNAQTKSGKSLRGWLKSKNIKYYIDQTEISPWRVWHFRMGWYEKMQTGKTAESDTSGWKLYRVDDDKITPISLPRKCRPVTRVPGL